MYVYSNKELDEMLAGMDSFDDKIKLLKYQKESIQEASNYVYLATENLTNGVYYPIMVENRDKVLKDSKKDLAKGIIFSSLGIAGLVIYVKCLLNYPSPELGYTITVPVIASTLGVSLLLPGASAFRDYRYDRKYLEKYNRNILEYEERLSYYKQK